MNPDQQIIKEAVGRQLDEEIEFLDFCIILRPLILEEDFTEVLFRNPRTNEFRQLILTGRNY